MLSRAIKNLVTIPVVVTMGVSMLGVGIASTVNAITGSPVVSESFSTKNLSGKTFTDGNIFSTSSGEKWRVVFAGYGNVQVTRDSQTTGFLRETPAAPSGSDVTHSALVVSNDIITPSTPCVNVSTRVRTVNQLRTETPANPWESAWVVWDYTDNDHFSYLAIKPNGWELGKRDPSYPGGQRFMLTSGTPSTPIGTWRTTTINRTIDTDSRNSTITIKLDGQQILRYVDTENAYDQGAVGMYTEDAVVDTDNIKMSIC